MPITQDRMLKLIEAAKSWQEYGRYLKSSMKDLVVEQVAGTISLEQFVDGIRDLAFDMVKAAPDDIHSEIIGREDQHYRLTHNRNDKNKAYLNRLRTRRVLEKYDADTDYSTPARQTFDESIQQRIAAALKRQREIAEDEGTPTRGEDPVEAWEHEHGAPTPEQIIDLGNEEPPV